MTPDETILTMLREVRDLSVPVPEKWAQNFARKPEEITAMIVQVSLERAAV